MSNWQQGDVLTNGIRMHYYRTGGNKPPLLLCHGFSDSGLCWTPVARALSADYDVIMIDARGHGLSEAPDGDYGPKTMAADLAGLVQALGLAPLPAIGHSMGGATAFQAVANYPELFTRAILEDAGPRDFVPTPGRLDPMLELKAKSREEIIALGHAQSPTWSMEELGPWADSKLQLSPKTLTMAATEREPWRETIKRLQCPLLVITADNDKGSGITPEGAAEAMQLSKWVQVVHIPGAGHNVRREQYDAYMAAVRAFLSAK